MIVHRSVAGELVDRLARAYEHVQVGDPREDGALCGPLITRPPTTACRLRWSRRGRTAARS